MHYALCTMHYALCTMRYALCTMHYYYYYYYYYYCSCVYYYVYYYEGMLSSKADGHAKELAVLRDSHAELTKQLQASDKKLGSTARQLDRHGQDGEAVAKRLEKLEREVEVAMETRADKHDKHVEDTQAVHDQLAQDIEELRAANLGADGKIARTDQAVGDVSQRLEALRLQQGQSDQKHAEDARLGKFSPPPRRRLARFP